MDRLARTVREQVALGRLLPLGGPEDAAWITERAAVSALRRVCGALPGMRLGEVAIVPDGADPDQDISPAAPLGALPHQPLRIEAGFAAAVDEPLPVAAERLRTALLTAAGEGIGLPVEAVDLEVTGLLDEGDALAPAVPPKAVEPPVEPGPPIVAGTTEAVQAAVRAVPGVLRLTSRLAGRGGLRIHDTRPPAEPARHVQLQIATAPSFSPVVVARHAAAAVASAAAPGAPGPVLTAVVVTDVG
jgi:hypothetical protein